MTTLQLEWKFAEGGESCAEALTLVIGGVVIGGQYARYLVWPMYIQMRLALVVCCAYQAGIGPTGIVAEGEKRGVFTECGVWEYVWCLPAGAFGIDCWLPLPVAWRVFVQEKEQVAKVLIMGVGV